MQHVTNIEAATESRAHFFMDRAPLAKAVAFMAKHIVERRNSIPILSNILIEAGPDCVTLMTNNLDLQAVITLPASVSSPGRFTMQAGLLADSLKKAGGHSVNIRDNGEGRAVISCGGADFKAPTLPADDFPVIATPSGGKHFTLSEEWARDMAAVSPCISKEEPRYYLNGIAMQCSNGRAFMVTADGPSMAVIDRPAPLGMAGMDDVIIPRAAISAMLAWAKDTKASGPLSVNMGARFMHAELPGGLVLTSKLIDGTFPQWLDVLASVDLSEPRAVPVPFLEPGMRLDTLTALEKATGKALSVEIGGADSLLTCPDYPEFFAVSRLTGNAAPKGFTPRTHEGEERRAIDYLRQICLDAEISTYGLTETRTHWQHGADMPTIQGVTFGAISQRAESTSREVETVDWETLTTKTETVYCHTPAQYQEGSFSAVMPGAASFDHRACTMEIMDDSGAWSEKAWIAQDDRGAIVLTADQVRQLAGETEAAPVHIPVATVWGGKVVALDGVPTENMPEGYTLALVPTGKEAKALRAKMAGMCIKNQAREIAAIAARFNPIRLAMPGELESPSAAQEPVTESPAPASVESAEIPAPESAQTPGAPIAPPEPVEASSEPENPAPQANSGPLSPDMAFAAWLTAQFGVWIIAGRQTAKMTAAGKRAITPRQYATLRAQWEHGDIAATVSGGPAWSAIESYLGQAGDGARIKCWSIAHDGTETPSADAQIEAITGSREGIAVNMVAADGARSLYKPFMFCGDKWLAENVTFDGGDIIVKWLTGEAEHKRFAGVRIRVENESAPPLVEKGAADMAAQIAELRAHVTHYRDKWLDDAGQAERANKAEAELAALTVHAQGLIDGLRADCREAERALVEAQNQAATLGADLRLATERMERAETALAAVEARANGWPPAAACVKSVTFASRRAA